MTDAEHYSILNAVKQHFEDPANFPGASLAKIWGFGPLSERGSGGPPITDCVVLHDPGDAPTLPVFINVTIGTETWKVFLNPRARRRFKLKLQGPEHRMSRRTAIKTSVSAGLVGAAAPFSSVQAMSAPSPFLTASPPDPSATIFICPPPTAPPGSLMGGDAIFNWEYLDADRPRKIYWGTVAYVASASGKIRFSGETAHIGTAGAAISCAHVLFHKNGNGNLRTYRLSSGISLLATLPNWSANWPSTPPSPKWPDLAAAALASSISTEPKEVRALGELQGVEAPVLGDVVAKYGASTGLTVARDIGMVWRRLPDEDGDFQLIRAVSNQFSRPGDSGAAVVHAGIGSSKWRKLAGFVLAGSTADNEQYYLPAYPFGTASPFADMSAAEVEL